jgi:magnesium and cobalt exporter, CNNM family
LEDIPLLHLFAALGLLLLASAFFSASEISLMSSNRYRLRHQAQSGDRGAILATYLLARTDQLFGIILLGNTFAAAALATIGSIITVRLIGEGKWELLGGTIAVTFVILVFGEISPKVVAASHAEKLAIACSYILYPLLKITYPAVWFVSLFVKAFLRLLGIKTRTGDAVQAVSMEELRAIVTDAGKFIPKKHKSILLNLFELENITVDDVMTAHTQIEVLDFDAPIETIVEQIATSHHTRMLVRQGANEEVIGILHIRKVMHQAQKGDLTQELLREVLADPYFVPSGTPLYTQLHQFQEKHERLALVVDEYGELKGLVTMEDILEEIVGDFTTQSPLNAAYHQQPDGSWRVVGGAQLRDINRKLGFNFPLDGPKTINGLVLEHFEDIPEPGTSFKIGEHTVEIVQTHDRIVKSVRITL